MKPFVVYVNAGESDEDVTLLRKEFEDMLKEAYEQGYSDGKIAGYNEGLKLSENPITTQPYKPWTPYTPYTPSDDDWWKKSNIYCTTSSSTSSGQHEMKGALRANND